MLVTSCSNFYKNILHVNIFILILKVAGYNFWLVYNYVDDVFAECNKCNIRNLTVQFASIDLYALQFFFYYYYYYFFFFLFFFYFFIYFFFFFTYFFIFFLFLLFFFKLLVSWYLLRSYVVYVMKL